MELTMIQSEREEEKTDEKSLSQFADAFAACAGKIIPNTGWVTYVVGPGLRIKHFLSCETNGAERADYEFNFAHLDPLSPMHCIARQRFVACTMSFRHILPTIWHTDSTSCNRIASSMP